MKSTSWITTMLQGFIQIWLLWARFKYIAYEYMSCLLQRKSYVRSNQIRHQDWKHLFCPQLIGGMMQQSSVGSANSWPQLFVPQIKPSSHCSSLSQSPSPRPHLKRKKILLLFLTCRKGNTQIFIPWIPYLACQCNSDHCHSCRYVQ